MLTLLSKLLLLPLLVLLAVKLGLPARLKKLKPKLDRAINLTIGGLIVIYVGQFLWWLWQR